MTAGDLLSENPGDQIVVAGDGTGRDAVVRVLQEQSGEILLELEAFGPGEAPEGLELLVADVLPFSRRGRADRRPRRGGPACASSPWPAELLNTSATYRTPWAAKAATAGIWQEGIFSRSSPERSFFWPIPDPNLSGEIFAGRDREPLRRPDGGHTDC